jgi:hypothetical protein
LAVAISLKPPASSLQRAAVMVWLFGCRYCIEATRIITAKGCSDGLAVCCHYCIEATSIISEKGCLKKNHNHASSAPILELSAKRCFALYKSTSLIF